MRVAIESINPNLLYIPFTIVKAYSNEDLPAIAQSRVLVNSQAVYAPRMVKRVLKHLDLF